MPLRAAMIASTLSLYFPPKLLRRNCPTLRRFLSPSSPKPLPLFSTLRPLCSTSAAVQSGTSSFSSVSSAAIELCYLSCSFPEKKPLKVAVLLSGGVDSSVALRLLHAAGHSCTAFYLKIWFQEDFENFWSECPWEEDLRYAKAVCDQGNYFERLKNLRCRPKFPEFVSYIIDEYRYVRTPNPDVLCNTRVKFGAFVDAISGMAFDYIASGHYAMVVHPNSDDKDELSALRLSKDMEEVRRLAKIFGLPNQDRKDSQGICFLGKIKFSEFVARHIGEEEGVILEAETGDFLGNHRGFWFYTIGQRQGLRLPGGPWYVVEKDVENNVVFVSRNYFSVDKRRRQFRVGSLRWFSGSPPRQITQIQGKVRHGPKLYSCDLAIEVDGNGHEIGVVKLSEDDQGLAAGQCAAFYQGSTCIGSGVILESWDDQGFPVCAKALEIAKTKDKSKLGKPIKIKVAEQSKKEEEPNNHQSNSSPQ